MKAKYIILIIVGIIVLYLIWRNYQGKGTTGTTGGGGSSNNTNDATSYGGSPPGNPDYGNPVPY